MLTDLHGLAMQPQAISQAEEEDDGSGPEVSRWNDGTGLDNLGCHEILFTVLQHLG